MTGTANVALRVTRTGNLSHWKGLAYPHVAKEGTFYALLATRGVPGPEEVFEGNKGFKESIAGDFEIDWSTEDLESVRRTIIKKYNAEIHSQSALEAALSLRGAPGFNVGHLREIRLRTFDVAHKIIGGGEESDKRTVRTKEEADHCLPWMLAVTLPDGELNPAEYAPERIVAHDVQQLMRKVVITPDAGLIRRFPDEMPADLAIILDDGMALHATESDYSGFHPHPWTGPGPGPSSTPWRRRSPTRSCATGSPGSSAPSSPGTP